MSAGSLALLAILFLGSALLFWLCHLLIENLLLAESSERSWRETWREEIGAGFSPHRDMSIMIHDPESGNTFIYHPRPKERELYVIPETSEP